MHFTVPQNSISSFDFATNTTLGAYGTRPDHPVVSWVQAIPLPRSHPLGAYVTLIIAHLAVKVDKLPQYFPQSIGYDSISNKMPKVSLRHSQYEMQHNNDEHITS